MFNTIWYKNLNTPLFSPPNWIYAPIWSFLYITIFCSFIIYLKKKKKDKKLGYFYFFTQLLLNFLWPYIFFNFQNILASFVVIIFLDIFIVLTIKNFFKISKLASWFLLPYLIWSIFATYLNFGYLILNR